MSNKNDFEYAWYFLKPNGKLGYGDCREVSEGVVHTVSVIPECCLQGLHASKKIVDALGYAQSSKVALVKISGSIDTQPDKICGSSREYIKVFDIEDLLFEFSRKQALSVWHLTKEYISEDRYNLVKKYLETGDMSLRDAARDAALDAALAAALDAARDAALAAAWDAALDSAWDAANKQLLDMIQDKFSYELPEEVYNA